MQNENNEVYIVYLLGSSYILNVLVGTTAKFIFEIALAKQAIFVACVFVFLQASVF